MGIFNPAAVGLNVASSTAAALFAANQRLILSSLSPNDPNYVRSIIAARGGTNEDYINDQTSFAYAHRLAAIRRQEEASARPAALATAATNFVAYHVQGGAGEVRLISRDDQIHQQHHQDEGEGSGGVTHSNSSSLPVATTATVLRRPDNQSESEAWPAVGVLSRTAGKLSNQGENPGVRGGQEDNNESVELVSMDQGMNKKRPNAAGEDDMDEQLLQLSNRQAANQAGSDNYGNLSHHQHHHMQQDDHNQQQEVHHELMQLQQHHMVVHQATSMSMMNVAQQQGSHHHHHHAAALMMASSARQRSSSGSIACQDCGNQAKKDCIHVRCRTCCKSRGYDCPTHIKSTWVPAAKRRERQQAELAAMVAGQPMPKSKRARHLALQLHHHHHQQPIAGLHVAAAAMGPMGVQPGATATQAAATSYTSTSTGTPPRSSDFNSAQQYEARFRGGLLPPEVRTQAVFKCVRLTGVPDEQDEYAYRATVKIAGRVFKGFLYDQGSDKGWNVASGVAELQLGGRSAPLSSALIDIYGAPGNALLGGD